MTRLLVTLAAVGLIACGGGGWGEADSKAATDAVRTEAMALSLCAPDAGYCKAPEVRALERASLCLNASQLARHGAPVPDAGVSCQP